MVSYRYRVMSPDNDTDTCLMILTDAHTGLMILPISISIPNQMGTNSVQAKFFSKKMTRLRPRISSFIARKFSVVDGLNSHLFRASQYAQAEQNFRFNSICYSCKKSPKQRSILHCMILRHCVSKIFCTPALQSVTVQMVDWQ